VLNDYAEIFSSALESPWVLVLENRKKVVDEEKKKKQDLEWKDMKKELEEKSKRETKVFCIEGESGAKGIFEGLDWIAESVSGIKKITTSKAMGTREASVPAEKRCTTQ